MLLYPVVPDELERVKFHAARFSFRISISIRRRLRSTNLCSRIVLRRDLGLQRLDSAKVSKYCCSIVFMTSPFQRINVGMVDNSIFQTLASEIGMR